MSLNLYDQILKPAGSLSLLFFLLFFPAAFSNASDNALKLHQVFYVDAPKNFQPSGLTIVNGCLYTISDKHDHFIYRLELKNDIASAIPAIRIRLPSGSLLHLLDFEGITHDGAGNFLLASESQCRVLKVPAKDGNAGWMTADLKPVGLKTGLFQVRNAGLEGICYVTDKKLILCAERQPRGFLEVNPTQNPVSILAYQSEKSKFKFPEGISKDFSGLYYFRNAVYVLERNAFIVSRLKREGDCLVESTGWSYRHIETMRPYRYADMTYGKAEGLCMDDNYIYIVIDNNGDSRDGNPDDRRPLLMVFEHPDNFSLTQ